MAKICLDNTRAMDCKHFIFANFVPYYFHYVPRIMISGYDLGFTIYFAIFIWVSEICEGYVLIFLFGYNRAWNYFGIDAFFHGNIKLGYGIFWTVFGPTIQLTQIFN